MANIKQQKKRIRVAERQRMENIRYRSSIKTAFRRVVEAVQSGDAEAVASAHATFVALVDRAAAKRALHPNTAARKKARVTRVIARGPQAEESKKRRVSNKAAPAQKAAPVEEAVADEPAADDDVIEGAAEAPADEPEAAADASADAPDAEAGDDAAPADDES
ncbi:MAG: 30S ribosomal protein S20 [Actinomycetota bacterium]